MPPRGRARSRPPAGPVPLTEADVAGLRERLAAGKKPRVVLLVDTALGAAGTTVAVSGFAEPAEGEYISVKLADDVVPFSPAELGMPVRGRVSAAPDAAPLSAAPPLPASLPLDPPMPYEPSGRPSPAKPSRLVAVPEPADPAPPDDLPAAHTTPTQSPPAKAPARKRAAKSAGMSLTMRFNGSAWTYESTRGGRRSSARPLSLGAVRAFADRLDDPPLRRDVLAAIDVCRQQAHDRAEALRAELERVEVELAELDE